MNRSEARELLMQLLFQMEAQNEFNIKIKTSFFTNELQFKNQTQYMEKVCDTVITHIAQIDETLETSSANWKVSRMAKVDLAIARLAVVEMMYMEDIPVSVSINEAVNLAKKFGTDESSKFVNGILGKVAETLEAV